MKQADDTLWSLLESLLRHTLIVLSTIIERLNPG